MSIDLKILVLAGGQGTRLRPLTDSLPKVLVPVLGRPFLEHVLEDLALQGFRRFVLSVGVMAEQVNRHFGDGGRLGYQVEYVHEDSPLGTGGAICHALPVLGQTFVVGETEVIRDPDTGEILDEEVTELASLRANKVKEKLSICSVASGNAKAVRKGMAIHAP